MGIFKSAQHVEIGRKKQSEGKIFEETFDRVCIRQNIISLVIPMGCKRSRFKLIPIKSPFDRVVVTPEGAVAFLDLKTIGSGQRFSRSMINPDQVKHLIALQQYLQVSGYLVHFREHEQVVFFTAAQLYAVLISKQSLTIADGLGIGSIGTMKPDKIFRKEAAHGI